jgi:hypothetical protein
MAVLPGFVVNPVTGHMAFGYDSAGNPVLPSTTIEHLFEKDHNSSTNLTIRNTNAGATARAVLALVSQTGSATISASSLAFINQMQINWTGEGQMAFLTTHASAGILFQTNGFNDRLRITETGDINVAGSLAIGNNRHFYLRSYTVGTLPAAGPAGGQIYVSNETGGAVPAFSDGTNWRRVTDRTIVA